MAFFEIGDTYGSSVHFYVDKTRLFIDGGMDGVGGWQRTSDGFLLIHSMLPLLKTYPRFVVDINTCRLLVRRHLLPRFVVIPPILLSSFPPLGDVLLWSSLPHRITQQPDEVALEKSLVNSMFFFCTFGDNNNTENTGPVSYSNNLKWLW